MRKKNNRWIYILLVVIAIIAVTTFLIIKLTSEEKESTIITYQTFNEWMLDKKVNKVVYSNKSDFMTIYLHNENTKGLSLQERLKYNDYKDSEIYVVNYPAGETFRQTLIDNDILLVNTSLTESDDFSLSTIIFYIILLGMLTVTVLMVHPIDFSNKKKIAKKQHVKFTDIIGHDEIIDDIKFITRLISDNSFCKKIGTKRPKGLLLTGDPGCGKTMIAKAMATEAKVAFIYRNASSFINKFVGVGASSIRSLFKEAIANAPCIIFLDEIDAIGKHRDNYSNTSEDVQTLNALLQEMDGFATTSGIFVIAATNRPECLDPALIRAGRFDRQLVISKPRDWTIRKQLFEHYLKEFTVSPDVNINAISKQTAGFTGADIATICNEASIIAMKHNKDFIDTDCIEEAIDQKIFKGNRVLKEQFNKDKEIVAYHEAGHAVMSYILKKPIARASIQSTTSGVGGAVFNEDIDTSLLRTKKDLENDILICYAGRASEEIKYKEVTTGASNDIMNATMILANYIKKYGFDNTIGLLNIDVLKSEHIASNDHFDHIYSLSKKLYDQCFNLLTEKYDLVEKLAQQLLKVETLNGDDIDKILNS